MDAPDQTVNVETGENTATDTPSASHALGTSPYTGEAEGAAEKAPLVQRGVARPEAVPGGLSDKAPAPAELFAARQSAQWGREAAALAAAHPDFDLDQLRADPVFALLLILDLCYNLVNTAWIKAVLYWLSIYRRYNTFIMGVFSLADFVYYISVTAVFLFLTVRMLEKKRWS